MLTCKNEQNCQLTTIWWSRIGSQRRLTDVCKNQSAQWRVTISICCRPLSRRSSFLTFEEISHVLQQRLVIWNSDGPHVEVHVVKVPARDFGPKVIRSEGVMVDSWHWHVHRFWSQYPAKKEEKKGKTSAPVKCLTWISGCSCNPQFNYKKKKKIACECIHLFFSHNFLKVQLSKNSCCGHSWSMKFLIVGFEIVIRCHLATSLVAFVLQLCSCRTEFIKLKSKVPICKIFGRLQFLTCTSLLFVEE